LQALVQFHTTTGPKPGAAPAGAGAPPWYLSLSPKCSRSSSSFVRLIK